MRSPVLAMPPAVSTTATALVAWTAIAMLAAAILTLYLVGSLSGAVPPEILEGLTSPAQFGARTT
jgi:hypothetical protein